MELLTIWRVLRRRWYLLLTPIVVVGLAVGYDVATAGPAAPTGYGTMVRYSAAQPTLPNRDGDYQDVWLASELTVNALNGWMRTTSYATAVAERAADEGLEFDPLALSVVTDQERSVGQIFLSWRNPDELAVIVEAALATLSEDNGDYFDQLGGEPASITVLDEPRIAPQAAPLVNRYEPFVRLALGVIAGVALAFLADYFDPTLHHRDELEALGLPVVASVPRD